MPREPAYAAERSQDGGAKAASERAKNRMFVASVRRRGVGSPELESQGVDPPWYSQVCGVHAVGTDARLCLKTLSGRLLGLFERPFVGFARRIALIRLGSAVSIRSKIRGAADPAQFSDRT